MTTPTTGTSVSATTLTGNAPVDSLLDGWHWSASTISYSFIVPGTSVYVNNYPDPGFWTQIGAFTTAQQAATLEALAAWSNVANIQFTASADNATAAGTIRLGFSYSQQWGNFVGETYLPSPLPSGGDLWLDPNGLDIVGGHGAGYYANSAFTDGSYAFLTLLHELGHALGLKHPFDSSTDGGGASLTGTASAGWDSRVFTIMSYTTLAAHPDAIGFTFNPTTPMLLDIAAIQAVYGANRSYNAGDTTYAFNDSVGQHYFQTLWDGGGTNTIVYTGTHGVSVDLREGYGSVIGNPVYAYTATNASAYLVDNLWIAYGTKIQVADLSGCNAAFTVNANNYGDRIICGTGTGTINGGSGGDTIIVGSGAETITCGTGLDTIVFDHARASYAISYNYNNGALQLTGPNGTEAITGAETFKFSDMTVATALLQPGANAITMTSAGATVHTTASNDIVTGLAGINTVVYTGLLSQYSISNNGRIQVQDSVAGRDGTDTLANIERIKFADRSVAFDLNPSFTADVTGNAGEVAKILGAVFGASSIAAHPEYVGLGLGFADSAMSYPNLMQLALNARLGTGFTNEQEIQLLYTNLFAHAASATDVAFWSGTISSGQYTQATLAEMAADTATNATNIDLVGLAATGVQYS
ncbi:MAG: matrixin family metalloprotease [Ramlibacter sp.]